MENLTFTYAMKSPSIGTLINISQSIIVAVRGGGTLKNIRALARLGSTSWVKEDGGLALQISFFLNRVENLRSRDSVEKATLDFCTNILVKEFDEERDVRGEGNLLARLRNSASEFRFVMSDE